MLISCIQGRVPDSATEGLVSTACRLHSLCADASRAGTREPAVRLLKCAPLFLRDGAAAQQYLLGALRQGLVNDKGVTHSLASQALALNSWLHLLTKQPCRGSPSALAEACAAPALMHRWVCQTLHSMQVLEPPTWQPGG